MDYNLLNFEEFSQQRPWRFNLANDHADLNRRIAREAVDAIKAAGAAGRQVLMILPVGPLDYSYWARLCNAERVSCAPLVSLNMDEYLVEGDRPISPSHPLSFRRFMRESLLNPLDPALRPDPANLHFPDPQNPGATTALVEKFGGADVCYGGMGITGHVAFNDPPEPGEACSDEAVRSSRTRVLTINRESATQMAMGGVNGNWDVLPRRAVTVGMYEILLSKRLHLTFMRSWHAGVLRRALFGPITGWCPGSFVQQHRNVEVTVSQVAAEVPLCNVAQATGETA